MRQSIFYKKQDLRTAHEKPSVWTIFRGAPRPRKSSNCVSPEKIKILLCQYWLETDPLSKIKQ